ncbi:hypothetical protein [Thioalkalivibrio sp. XN279]|uniref:hypothetical protein n=1 Tax=Thioalkalivibrio sp. XN279 TaxID=2714953 RepID=UPI001409C1C3|nr:hypothetical protein [Thioalkalivibrio sp. XN279]NHA14675.1 hypothetical protein [Thioalkalivibrio sp. XN279]
MGTTRGIRALLVVLAAGAMLSAPVQASGFSPVETLVMAASSATALDDRQLRTLRSEAQRERQQQRNLRKQQLNDAARTFRVDAGNLEADYKESARAIDTEFKLEEVGLQAEIDAKIAALEAEMHKRLNARIMAGTGEDMAQQMQAMEQEAKAYQDRLFEARKRGAAHIHAARLRAEARKDALFLEMDQLALRRADELGLTTTPEPILAAPIGGELTRQEAQWNERELTEVERITERHAKLLAGFRNGERLRAWERANLEQDFALDWQERSELQALESQQTFFNAFLMQSAEAGAFDQQAYVERLADITEQQRLIKIRYEQVRRENQIKRREEKRALSGG